jgi:LysR family transcriptional regulator, hydrogen peroxide-inducible genes activator
MKFSPHDVTLRQLQYVVAVADELSFRSAAARCRVSQPSLSAQLAQLEDALGVTLFERTKKRVLITAAGRAIIDQARRVLIGVDDLEQLGRHARDPLGGTLRIGVIPTIAPYLLPAIAPALRTAFPRMTIAWREDKTETLVSQLASGDIDAALLALEADIGDVAREIIAEDRFVLAVRKGDPLAKKTTPATALDLQDANVLLLDDGHCFRDQALEICTTAHARESEFRSTSLTTLVQMVAGGGGVTLLPELSVATEATRANLCVRAIALPSASRTIALIWRKPAPFAAALRELAAVARTAYPRLAAAPRRTAGPRAR